VFSRRLIDVQSIASTSRSLSLLLKQLILDTWAQTQTKQSAVTKQICRDLVAIIETADLSLFHNAWDTSSQLSSIRKLFWATFDRELSLGTYKQLLHI
jgi:hypothetical protein